MDGCAANVGAGGGIAKVAGTRLDGILIEYP
jgi:hypothetical protein